MRRILIPVAALLAVSALIVACGGSDSPSGPGAPTISITSPSSGAVVQGSVNITAAVTEAAEVRFLVDGVEIARDDAAPYATTWNSTAVEDGSHTIRAEATGGGGTAADEIGVTVDNGGNVEVTIAVTPVTASIATGGTVQFTAEVTGATNPGVTWSVVQGASHGSVSAGGLYTAPASVPSPPTATVRAVSLADPSRMAEATVTITTSGGGGIDADTRRFAGEIYGAGYQASQGATELVELGIQAVFEASIQNASQLTVTGTLTQTAPGAETFTWSSQPSDRLLVVFSGGPTVEMVFAAFDGFLGGGWEDFRDSHGLLDFQVKLPGVLDGRVTSTAGPRQGAFNTSEFQRTVSGTIVVQGETLTLQNLSYSGSIFSSVESSSTEYETEELTSGTITSPRGTITVSSYYRYKSIFVSNFVENLVWENASSGVIDGSTYGLQNALVRQAFSNTDVADPEFWIAQGVLVEAGEAVAQIAFDRAIIEGTPEALRPQVLLQFGDGSTQPLRPEWIPPLGKAMRGEALP